MQFNSYDFSVPQRQSSTGIIVMFVNTLQKIIRSLAIPLFLVIVKSGMAVLTYVFLGIAVIIILIAFFAYFKYKAFTFYLDEERQEFVINEGVFVKTNLTIHLDKIQQVNINQSILQRIIGNYTLQIDTAGTDKKEGNIKAMEKELAEELKRKLLNRSVSTKLIQRDKQEEASAHPEASEPFLKLSPLTLLKVGATSNYGQTIALVLAFLAAGFQSLKEVTQLFEVNQEEVGQAIKNGATLASIGVVIFMLLLFLLAFNIVRTFLRYFDFEVFRQKASLVVTAGLLAKRNTFMNAHRVQITVVVQNYFQKKLNMLDMRMKQNSTVTQSNKQTKNSDVEIPGCSPLEKDQILKMIFDEVPEKGTMLTPNFRFVFLPIFFRIIFPSLIFLAFNKWVFPISGYYFYIVAYSVLNMVMIYFSFRNHRIYVSKDYIIKKHGIWDVQHLIIVPEKIQAITAWQYLWHKKANIGHITCHTAAGNISFRFGDYDKVKELMNYWLYQVESSEKGWM